jgi:hypothetical protein
MFIFRLDLDFSKFFQIQTNSLQTIHLSELELN